MIGKINGLVAYKDGNTLLVQLASGISYLVNVTFPIASCAITGETIELFTELIVREDSWMLYGFTDIKEKKLFNLLNTVQGVGAKSSIAILSNISKNDIVQAINSNQYSVFCAAPGIGEKIAKRITNELANKIQNLMITSDYNSEITSAGDVLSALLNLGFKRNEAVDAISDATKNSGTLKFEELLKEALKRVRK